MTMQSPAPEESSRFAVPRIFDGETQPAFDALAQAASGICTCPIAWIRLIDEGTERLHARVGIDEIQIMRAAAFHAVATADDALIEVDDALDDWRFPWKPLVAEEAGIRFYAGQPIVFGGVVLGTLCVADRVPRHLTDLQRSVLAHLAAVAGELFDGRMAARNHQRDAERLQRFAALSGDWLWECDAMHRCTWVSGNAENASGLFYEALPIRRFRDVPVLDWVGRQTSRGGLLALLDAGMAFSHVVVETITCEGRRFIALAAEPMIDTQGRVAGFRGSARDITSRLDAEIALRTAELAFRKTAMQMPGAIYQLLRRPDGTSRFPYASEALCEVFEVTAEAAMADASHLFGTIHPEDIDDVAASIVASRTSGTIWHARFRVQLPVKGLRWLQGSSLPEQLPDGGTLWHGYITDVTESHARDRDLAQAHAALQTGERWLRALTDHLPALVTHVDVDERYTFANARVASAHGRDAAQMLGRTILEVRGETVHRRLKPYIDRVMGGDLVTFDDFTDIGCSRLYFESTYVPDSDADGQCLGFYAMSLDVTDRREAELRLAASERLLRGITDNLPALVCYIDREQRHLFASAAHQSWLGLDHHAMIGKRIDEVFDSQVCAVVQPFLKRATEGERVSFERHDTTDGRNAYYAVAYVPDIDDDGHVAGVYGMATDVTALRMAERARTKSEQLLRDITDNLPVLISHMDADERMTYANDTFLDAVGLTRDGLIGRMARDAFGPLYGQCRGAIRRCLGGERIDFDLRSRIGPSMKYLQATYLPDFGKDGAVVGMTTLSIDVTDLKVAQMRLSRLAHFDQLTGLPNRLQFNDKLAEMIADDSADGLRRAIMFLDLDHFKSINDAHGHGVGDVVLQIFANRIRSSIRPTDFVARLAGDEFVVILASVDSVDDAERIARDIIGAVGAPFSVNGSALAVTTCIGIAMRDAAAHDAASIMARADSALYRAKDAGRNTYRLAAIAVRQ